MDIEVSGAPSSLPASPAALDASVILDRALRPVINRHARLAARLLDARIAVVSVVDDRQHRVLSAFGLARPIARAPAMPTLQALCAQVEESCGPLAIPDVSRHFSRTRPDLADAMPGAYLGVPLSMETGAAWGVLAVVDGRPRRWSKADIAALSDLAQALGGEVGLHLHRRRAERAEQALRRGEARTSEILESMDEAFYALDRDWRLVYVNRAAERLWGRGREELLGLPLLSAFPAFADTESYKALQRAMSRNESVRIEAVSPVQGLPVEVAIYPGPSGLSVYFNDLSARLRMERQLRERDEILTLAERSAGIGIWDIDLPSGMVRGTPQFFRIMGLEPAAGAVPIEALRRLRHADDQQRVLEGFQQALAGGGDTYEIEYRIVLPEGKTRWIFGRGRVIRDPSGTPVRYSGIDIDITERKLAEAALAESEERLRLAQEAGGIGTWDWDIDTGAIHWSASQWRLHGLEPGARALELDHWRSAIHPEDRAALSSALAEAVNGRERVEVEYRVFLPDGELRWLASLGKLLSDEQGRPSRVVGVNVDITERRGAAEALARVNQELERRVYERTAELEAEASRRAEAEARLLQAQKMEAVGQLTGGIAHDFNNLLTVILGNLDFLQRRLAEQDARPEDNVRPDRTARSIDMATQAANQAAQLTHRLLAFSRRQALQPAALSVNDLVQGMEEMIRRTLGETIRVEPRLAPGLWPTFADANQLESALLNLVVNARDAMPDGGVLTIETGHAGLDDLSPDPDGAVPPSEYVLLSVSDTGTGIPRDLLTKVFEPFFTTKDTGKGSGLGLSMVYGFARQSGGDVRIYSEEGIGTTVRLYLPPWLDGKNAAAAAVRRVREDEPLPRANTGETILVVEDDDAVRQYAASALQELGYRVLEAENGEAALRHLESASVRIDLLFTDVVLPGGMSGRNLAAIALEARPDLPVLYTTGYTRNAIVHHDRLDPDVELLSKPYTLDALARKLRHLLDHTRDDSGRQSRES